MHFGGVQRGACNRSSHPRPDGFCAPLRARSQFRGPAGPAATRWRRPPRAWLAALRGSRQARSGNSWMERLGARVGRASFPRLEGRARKHVLPVRDRNLDSPAIGGLRGLSRAGRQARLHSRPGGLPAGLAPGFGRLCAGRGRWGRGRELEGAGGGSRGLSWDSMATLPSPHPQARPWLGTGCVLVVALGGHLFAFLGSFTPVVWLPQGDLPEGVSARERSGCPQAAGRRRLPLLGEVARDPPQTEGP